MKANEQIKKEVAIAEKAIETMLRLYEQSRKGGK